MDKQMFALYAMFTLSALTLWLIFGAVRHVTSAKAQVALQERFLRHVTSPESLSVFLASPTGESYLRELQRDPQHPRQRLISGVQVATVFCVLGLGGLLAGAFWRGANVVLPMAFAAIVLAVAIGVSMAVGYWLYRRTDMFTSANR